MYSWNTFNKRKITENSTNLQYVILQGCLLFIFKNTVKNYKVYKKIVDSFTGKNIILRFISGTQAAREFGLFNRIFFSVHNNTIILGLSKD